MPKILAIDTATGPSSVAIWDGEHIAAYSENKGPMAQSATLLPMIENALKTAKLGYRDLDLVACTTGPGSFTGIRVGLAAARGIAFAAGIKSAGFTTLEVLAHGAAKHGNASILAILNAGKGECYYQYFDGKPREPALGTLEKAIESANAPVIMAGNMEVKADGFTACPITFPRADALAELAAATTSSPKTLIPFYIRAPDAKLPSKKP